MRFFREKIAAIPSSAAWLDSAQCAFFTPSVCPSLWTVLGKLAYFYSLLW